ncbi:MAG TPA: hypothetical protein VM934_10885 [Pyrinomonadaceae bacterium]|jgi:hypothetical protein|nr:hypothetical protein [Pyrinomonadaceae bacterium]
MRIRKRTLLLNIFTASVVIVTGMVTLATLRNVNQNLLLDRQQKSVGANQRTSPSKDRQGEDFENQFPVVDYDAPLPTEDGKRKEREKKSQRYDRFGIVSKRPSNEVIVESVLDNRWQEGVAALPTAQSVAIIIGKVQEVTAHLSSDKSGIYTEAVVHVEEILKEDSAGKLSASSEISVSRPGGFVRYPNGHKRLYRVFGMNMPRPGRRYVLFLSNPEQSQNYDVVTGYELNSHEITPLDVASHFDIYKGMDEAVFLKTLRDAIAQSLSAESK